MTGKELEHLFGYHDLEDICEGNYKRCTMCNGLFHGNEEILIDYTIITLTPTIIIESDFYRRYKYIPRNERKDVSVWWERI